MKNTEINVITGMFIAFLFTVFIGGTAIIKKNDKITELKETAIGLGCAEYNRTNGNWQWITNRLDK